MFYRVILDTQVTLVRSTKHGCSRVGDLGISGFIIQQEMSELAVKLVFIIEMNTLGLTVHSLNLPKHLFSA